MLNNVVVRVPVHGDGVYRVLYGGRVHSFPARSAKKLAEVARQCAEKNTAPTSRQASLIRSASRG